MLGILAVVGAVMSKISEGAILAATVYMVSKGVDIKGE